MFLKSEDLEFIWWFWLVCGFWWWWLGEELNIMKNMQEDLMKFQEDLINILKHINSWIISALENDKITNIKISYQIKLLT